ncbi:hypothetical protein D9M71_773380 [compost metagenome]
MYALADGDGTGGVGLGAFAGRIQAVGVDVHRRQFHGRAVLRSDQHIATITLTLRLQATVAQQPRQTFLDTEAAFQARAVEVARLCGVERNGHTRLYAKLGDGVAQ